MEGLQVFFQIFLIFVQITQSIVESLDLLIHLEDDFIKAVFGLYIGQVLFDFLSVDLIFETLDF